jgi:HK97 family phage prohead protease
LTARFQAEFRSEVDGNRLVGRAAVFGAVAKLRSHYEAIGRSAFDEALQADHDIKAMFNHSGVAAGQYPLVLGSTRGKTLRLETDDDGLAFEVDLPDTSYARDLKELVSRGDISAMSFGFLPGADAWTRTPDGRQLRTHTSVERLLDVSPVAYPAYEGTEVYLRAQQFDAQPLTPQGQMIRLRAAQLIRRK